ncbi:MAG: YqcI/YcgG family protein [Lysobacter sp.]|nr:YqcI/YcgG family protein [Lysobacter sp.]MBA3640728.1 YqcI/YcgG family protein [Acidobacteriota bacterium]
MTTCPARLRRFDAYPASVSTTHAQTSARSDGALTRRFFEFVDDHAFPCVGSKAALARGAIQAHEFEALGHNVNDAPLLDRLHAFAAMVDACDPADTTVHSFVSLFDGPFDAGEQRFDALLWSQLQRLYELDVRRGSRWAEDVSRDPDSPQFSLSLGGHPFFVIGLHPGASRIARRFTRPTLVFNSHRQFEQLRADGRYQKMQAATRERDRALQGSINPNLADFGAASETRQYSGREVEPGWRCPFHVRKAH